MPKCTREGRYVWLSAVVTLMVAYVQCAVAHAQSARIPGRDMVFTTDGSAISVKGYLPKGQQERPAVILLHGRGGFEAFPEGFERYATHLATEGIEAYLFPYYDAQDRGIMNSTNRQERLIYFRGQIDKWSNRVEQLARSLLTRKDPVSSVGLIGFSNGGFVAVAAAGKSKMFSALAVLYGGAPDWLPNSMMSLPPTLIIHGEADRVIPIAEGEKLQSIASRLGTRAELVRVPEADHGFDLMKDGTRSEDSRLRVIAFLVSALKKP